MYEHFKLFEQLQCFFLISQDFIFFFNLIIELINTFKYAISHLDMKRKKDLVAPNAFKEAA